jgi:hypothetical protein
MNTSLEDLLDSVRVLVWDATLKQWKIGQLKSHLGQRMWVFDPKIFHPIDSTRFPGWESLPRDPE